MIGSIVVVVVMVVRGLWSGGRCVLEGGIEGGAEWGGLGLGMVLSGGRGQVVGMGSGVVLGCRGVEMLRVWWQ